MIRETEEKWFEKKVKQQKNEAFFSIVLNPENHPNIEEEITIGNISIDIDAKDRVGKLGIVIGEKQYWGKGYGTESLELMLEYGFNTLNLQRIELEA